MTEALTIDGLEFVELATLDDGEELTFGYLVGEEGERQGCIVYERSGYVFTTRPGEAADSLEDVGNYDWFCGDVTAILFPSGAGVRLPLLPPWG